MGIAEGVLQEEIELSIRELLGAMCINLKRQPSLLRYSSPVDFRIGRDSEDWFHWELIEYRADKCPSALPLDSEARRDLNRVATFAKVAEFNPKTDTSNRCIARTAVHYTRPKEYMSPVDREERESVTNINL